MPNTRKLDLRMVCGHRGDLGLPLLDEIYRLRYDIFRTQLGWDVTGDDGREMDEYDTATTYYVAAVDRDNRLLGTCRLRATTGSYMVRDTFPSALGNLTPPSSPLIWEMSRLAVAPGQPFAEGFGPVATSVVAAALDLVGDLGGDTMLVFSHQDVERKIRAAGFTVRRVAPPIRIDGKACTAYTLPVGAR
ncbi:acyl-homoserine-lactone synthase [Nocardia sp. NPDC050406]|uniref:acyl-homoserine-lactone synthase n=1 Tax=Nocardia sp. NPDC050406 TaxID=3364318 RepID=UPI0037B59371